MLLCGNYAQTFSTNQLKVHVYASTYTDQEKHTCLSIISYCSEPYHLKACIYQNRRQCKGETSHKVYKIISVPFFCNMI